MAAPKSVITDAEFSVLKLPWDRSALSAREIATRLYEEVNPSSMGTVQKLIARVEERRERAAQLRLLQLDVGAAQFKADAAKGKVALLANAF